MFVFKLSGKVNGIGNLVSRWVVNGGLLSELMVIILGGSGLRFSLIILFLGSEVSILLLFLLGLLIIFILLINSLFIFLLMISGILVVEDNLIN